MSEGAQRQAGKARRASIAVDLGAESCRVSLLRWVGGQPQVQLVHRLANGPVHAADGSLRWPLQAIAAGVDAGIARAAGLAPEGIDSIAVDGWAVDYVRLDAAGRVLEEPYCYRDERNRAAATALHQHISVQRTREITGIEQQPINTLYQMYADKLSGKSPARWLNLPEYLLYRWGGEPVAEYTNASHTQMVDLHAGEWSGEIFRAAQLDRAYAPRIVPPGTLLGKLRGELANLPGLQETALIAPACHDTASAVAGIPQTGDDWAYISCGTWSLVGTLVHTPLNAPAVQADNFTNLGAVGGMTCFHKGMNGMWVLKRCMEDWAGGGYAWNIPDLLRAAELVPPPGELLHVDDAALMSMGRMPGCINAQRVARGLPSLGEHGRDAPAMVSLLLHSLAARYTDLLEKTHRHSGKSLRRIVMVGGGAQNAMLCRLTAERTGMDVVVGPMESSTLGNFAVQCAVRQGEIPPGSVAFAQEVACWAQQIASAPFRTLSADC